MVYIFVRFVSVLLVTQLVILQVSVVHCSAGIEYVPGQSVVMDPAEVANLTFILYSFHSISQINQCEGA